MPSRAPTPDERQRDAARTREALLDAAAIEFGDKGRAGARVSAIADRAGVSKQLISYYFGGKDGLYDALVARWYALETAWQGERLPLPDLVARYLEGAVDGRHLARLFLRESLDDVTPAGARADGNGDVEDLRRRQAEGEIAEDLDPGYLLLALQGAVSASLVFPAEVRRLTGLEPDSPEFLATFAEQIRRIVRRLAVPPPTGTPGSDPPPR